MTVENGKTKVKSSHDFSSISNKLRRFRSGVFVILVVLIAAIGISTYAVLNSDEFKAFNDVLKSDYIRVSTSISKAIDINNGIATSTANFCKFSINQKIHSFPNVTVEGFESIFNALLYPSYSRSISFIPIITNRTRNGWEYYVNNLQKANLSEQYIFTYSETSQKIYDQGIEASSIYPNILTPIWQSTSSHPTHNDAILYNDHSDPIRRDVIDKVLSNKSPGFSDLIKNNNKNPLESQPLDPITIFYSPVILDLKYTNPNSLHNIFGLTSVTLSWSDLFQSIAARVPSLSLYCVLTSSSTTFTFHLTDGHLKSITPGDVHSKAYSNYGNTVHLGILSQFPSSSSDYTLTVYPTPTFYRRYMTSTPILLCVIEALLAAATSLLVLFYVYLMSKREGLLKQMVVGYFSHELRTPLNIAMIGLQVVKRERVKHRDPTHLKILDTLKEVENSCGMAVGILNDLVTYERLESGQLQLNLKTLPMLPILEEKFNDFRVQATIREIDFRVYYRYNPANACIEGDEEKVEQIVRNILANAFESTGDRGKVMVIVDVDLTPSGNYLVIEVKDSGPSISTENQANMFHGDKIQFTAGVIEAGKAGGLGLLISHRLILLHRGTIEYASGSASSNVPQDFVLPRRSINVTSQADMRTINQSPLATSLVTDPVKAHSKTQNQLQTQLETIPQKVPSRTQSQIRVNLPSNNEILTSVLSEHSNNSSNITVNRGNSFTIRIPVEFIEDLKKKKGRNISSLIKFSSFRSVINSSRSNKSRAASDAIVDSAAHHQRLFSNLYPKGGVQRMGGDSHAKGHFNGGHIGHLAHHASVQRMISLPNILREEDEGEGDGDAEDADSKDSENNVESFRVNGAGDLSMIGRVAQRQRSYKSSVSSRQEGMHTHRAPRPQVRRVLVVDDVMMNRKMLGRLIETHCETTIMAEDGKIAVEKVRQAQDVLLPFDLVLMDYQMPNMDGPTAARKMRELGFINPIIGVTGNVLTSHIETFIAHGADRVLPKPLDFDELQKTVSELGMDFMVL